MYSFGYCGKLALGTSLLYTVFVKFRPLFGNHLVYLQCNIHPLKAMFIP
jgi:hypothetical protein